MSHCLPLCLQVDTHINNQYNTCYWALRQQAGKSGAEAQAALRGTQADAKNELLFSSFGINYSTLPARFRKGSILLWEEREVVVKTRPDGSELRRKRRDVVVLHEDLISDVFWSARPELLAA